jgi:hypothetical protein
MALRLEDKWIWDSWYVFDGQRYHAFYLHASRALGDPVRRHRHPIIGHAVSDDLTNWTVVRDAIIVSDSPAFDSWTTWTGSVIRDDNGVFSDPVRESLKLELGDVLWYVAQLASELGLDLDAIANANLDKLASRAARNVIAGSGDQR